MSAEVMTAPEGRIIHTTYAVLSGAAIPQRVHVTQYDESLPVIACTLYKDGQLYTIPDGASVRLRMNKNGLPVYHEAIGIDNARHVVYLEITAQMTVLYGEFAMVIEVETSDGKTAGTSYLRLIVRQNPVQNPELDNIPDYTANSNRLTAEGVKKLQDESSTQQKAIEDKGKNTLESIPADYSTLSGKVDKNTSGISELKEDYIGNGIVPIKKIGAVGDGITDDYIAFQTAINDKSIKEITLEPKTYLIKTILRITDRAGIKITGNGATIKFDVGDAVNLNDYCFEAANMTNLIIENCTFDGGYEWIERPLHTADTYQNYLDMRAKARHAFRLTNCTQFYVNNVTVQNTLAGFWITGCTHGALNNCKSLNTLADSVFLVGSHNISVSNHYSNNIDDDSYVSINYTTTASNYANSFDNCYTVKGFGALCCFYGSYSATIRNSRIDSCSYTPLKLGAHNQYKIAGSNQVVENCVIYLTEDIDNYNDNVLNICEGISSNERASEITLSNVSLYFAKSDGYTIRIVDTNNINIINFNCQCNFEMTACNNASVENSTLTTVTFNNVLHVPIRSSRLTSISAIDVTRLISLGNTISATPTITFSGANSLCTIDDNNFANNGNIHFLMTTNPLLPEGSPHLAFLIGTILHSGGNLIYVTNTGYKILATD